MVVSITVVGGVVSRGRVAGGGEAVSCRDAGGAVVGRVAGGNVGLDVKGIVNGGDVLVADCGAG